MKKEKKHLTILLLANGILLLSVITTKVQQQDSTKQVNLKDVTITASRSEKAPLDAGRSISVITGEEIKNSGVNTISEVLPLQEGIYIVGNTQSPGQLQSILYSIWNTMKYMAIAPVAEGFI
jgi:outer membrane receptor for ferrienterochelin and colicin